MLQAAALPSHYSSNLLQGIDKNDPKKVGALFEAIFYRIMLQQMREGGFDDELFGSREMDFVKEMRDDELANCMGAMGQLGMVDLVLKEAERNQTALPAGLLKSQLGRG